MLTAKEQSLFDALAPQAAALGIEIVTVEIVGAKKSPIIRVYIDSSGGISFDELSSSQAWINEVMDRIDPFPGAYTLEVSSPGIDRPLRTLEHFTRFAGEAAVIKTREPLQGRSKWTGKLIGVEDGNVLLEVDEVVEGIPFSIICRAHLRGAVDFG